MSWSLILEVLHWFGFSNCFCNRIRAIFYYAQISILLNGSPEGYFRCSRRVCQGDPLSPLLFGLTENFLSMYFLALVYAGDLLPIASPCGVVPHLICYTRMMSCFSAKVR